MYKNKRPPPIFIPNGNSKYYMSERNPPPHAPIIEIKYNNEFVKTPQIENNNLINSPSPKMNCNNCLGGFRNKNK